MMSAAQLETKWQISIIPAFGKALIVTVPEVRIYTLFSSLNQATIVIVGVVAESTWTWT